MDTPSYELVFKRQFSVSSGYFLVSKVSTICIKVYVQYLEAVLYYLPKPALYRLCGKRGIIPPAYRIAGKTVNMGDRRAYERITLEGVEVIAWKHSPSDKHLDSADKKKRKALKIKVGDDNKDIPMLDMRITKTGPEYRVIVMSTYDIGEWEHAIRDHYKNYTLTENNLKYGKQLTVLSNAIAILTFTLYNGTKRMLVQPGDQDEQNLLAFLRDLPAVSAKRLSMTIPTPEETITEPKDILGDLEPVNENVPASTRSDLANVPRQETPPKTNESNITTNELLCFVQNRMQSLPIDNIIKLCIDFYSAEEITASKQILYDHTVNTRPDRCRLIKRTGSNRDKENMRDLIKVLLSLEIKDSPVYVARDLSKLSFLGAFDNDVLGLHREVAELKQSIQLIHDCSKDIASLAE